MDNISGGYPEQMAMQAAIRRPSVQERLVQERSILQERLAAIDAALAALERTPGVAEVLEALSKVTGL